MRLFALWLVLCLALSGCQVSGEIENQAYVLILGAERLEDGQVGLTARVPKIGKSAGGGDKGDSGGSPYLTFSVSGDSWLDALEALELATPRPVNLSHIEMIVVSDALASEAGFPALLGAMTDTPHLYATARFVICRGSARAFIEAGETVIGTRMSAELRAMLRHYADEGYIPDRSLADACFSARAPYSDPVAIWAMLERDEPASEGAGTVISSPMRQRYCGAALTRGGRFVGALTLPESRLLNLILGGTRTLPYSLDGLPCAPKAAAKPALGVDIDGAGNVALRVTMRLCDTDSLSQEEKAKLCEELQRGIAALIGRCQALDCDPFGFSEQAATRFLTIREFVDSGWRAGYVRASVEVSVNA